jgi:hypothetical protein
VVRECGSEQARQCEKQKHNRETSSAYIKPTPNAKKNLLPVKKGLKCFGANENIYRFCVQITIPRILSRRVAGFAAKHAKLGFVNCVLVLSRKILLPAGNVFDRNCIPALSGLCEFDTTFLFIILIVFNGRTCSKK